MSKYEKYVTGEQVPGNKNIIRYITKVIESNEDAQDHSGDKLASYDFIVESLKSLTGRVLTVIDASISEGKQNKCIKDLIRKEFMHEFVDIGDLLFDKQRIERAMEDLDGSETRICEATEVLEA